MAFWPYLRYRLRARGRHGTHSPFFYRLAAECLMQKPGAAALDFARTMKGYGWDKAWSVLVFRLLEYFRPGVVRIAARDAAQVAGAELAKAGIGNTAEGTADLFIVADGAPDWESVARDGSVVLVKLDGRRSDWEGMKAQPGVRASADFFCGGLLVFDAAFVEAQHVVLRQRVS